LVCSACGFENLAGMRFCGMCGTPLPHRPLTTPGAQSTISLTRVPLEGGVSSPGRSTSSTGSRTAVSPEMPGTDGGTAATEVTAPWGAGDPAADAEDFVSSTSDTQPTELVPDIPLDEYLQSFQYQPPSEPDEISMRGDASVAEQTVASAEETSVAPSAPVEVTAPGDANASTTAAEIEGTTVIAEVPADTVESRLGLEPEAPEEVRAERPHFLDLGEPRETEPAMSGTSIITGPSFLGLNDPPETRAGFGLPKPRKVRRSHWGAWSAAAVVLIFAGLGWMQYRSQVDHTNNGPVEIVKVKVREWRQRVLARVGSEPAPATSVAANRKPHMQVQPQPGNEGDNTNGPASSATGDAASSAAQTSATAGATPSYKPPLVSTTLQPITAAGGAAAKPAAPVSNSNQEAVPKPSLAGAEEMAKAKNASDAAATAAWLWKATAKGNPDAPVQLADMYIGGQGVPRSCEQAMVLLKTAAAKENARARNRLASMYATGTCVQRDRVQAYRWLSSALSANPNSDWAKQNRDLIWQQMTPDERAQAEKYR
jgi:hypothetical protein